MTRAMTLAITTGAVCVACHADLAPNPTYLTDPYGSLHLETQSIVMSLHAPYNTLQLHATPYSMSGTPIATLGTPTYTVSDTSIVVSSTGVVTAKTQTSNSFVVVTLRDSAQNLTHVDTAFITVTNETAPPTLASLSLQPAPGDSAKLAIYDGTLAGTKTLVMTATGTNGADLTSVVPVRYRSSDSSVATVPITQPVIQGWHVGKSVISATTTWYGMTKSASVTMQIGHPIFFTWLAKAVPSPTAPGQFALHYPSSNFTIGVGGVVLFAPPFLDIAHQGMVMDVIFDDPTAAQPIPAADTLVLGSVTTGSGNVHVRGPMLEPGDTSTSVISLIIACVPAYKTGIPPFVNVCQTTRYFPRAGSYAWHSDLWGTHGTITVTEP